jgi:hypothetical protein
MKHIFIILFLFSNLYSNAQEFESGNISQIGINKSLSKDWKLNFSIESRQIFFDGVLGESFNENYQYNRTEFSVLGARKMAVNQNISAGYLIRFQETSIIHRFLQQYTIVNKFNNFKLAHRFSLNQTKKENIAWEHRFRYRIGLEKPFSGQAVDAKEFYGKLSNEYLLEVQDYNVSDFEIRALAAVGYSLNKTHKIETGLDYRISNLPNSNKSHEFWLFLAWFVSL